MAPGGSVPQQRHWQQGIPNKQQAVAKANNKKQAVIPKWTAVFVARYILPQFLLFHHV